MNVGSYSQPYLPVQRPETWQQQPQRLAEFNAHEWLDEPQEGESLAREGLAILQDKRLSVAGDLGWSLGYATAYLYRFLNSNRFAVVAAINNARRVPVDKRTPLIWFETLDRDIFNGKLSGVVLLLWKALGTSHPGMTCATRVEARRICIQLNSTPFEERTASEGQLLEMLIHHMIHAYFLICCGAQRPTDKQDGRLLDGLHFGVILSTINDITLDCDRGSTSMTFHAAKRNAPGQRRSTRGRGPYISLDPVGTSLSAPAADGKSHCMHDNRNTTRAQVMNWQVQDYAKAVGEDWESRGEEVSFWIHGRHHKMRRVDGPPSKYYSEVIWDGKRFAVPKERALKFTAMSRLTSDNKYGDMKLPECSADVFDCLWKFVTYGGYHPSEALGEGGTDRTRAGPPILLSPHSGHGESLKLHIQVCKLADAMRFPELQQYVIRRLYELPATTDDPIALLRDVYDKSKPLSIELQSWTRKFLARTDEPSEPFRPLQGVSNYEKIYDWHPARFLKICNQYAALQDDCNLVYASILCGITLDYDLMNPSYTASHRHRINTSMSPGGNRGDWRSLDAMSGAQRYYS